MNNHEIPQPVVVDASDASAVTADMLSRYQTERINDAITDAKGNLSKIQNKNDEDSSQMDISRKTLQQQENLQNSLLSGRDVDSEALNELFNQLDNSVLEDVLNSKNISLSDYQATLSKKNKSLEKLQGSEFDKHMKEFQSNFESLLGNDSVAITRKALNHQMGDENLPLLERVKAGATLVATHVPVLGKRVVENKRNTDECIRATKEQLNLVENSLQEQGERLRQMQSFIAVAELESHKKLRIYTKIFLEIDKKIKQLQQEGQQLENEKRNADLQGLNAEAAALNEQLIHTQHTLATLKQNLSKVSAKITFHNEIISNSNSQKSSLAQQHSAVENQRTNLALAKEKANVNLSVAQISSNTAVTLSVATEVEKQTQETLLNLGKSRNRALSDVITQNQQARQAKQRFATEFAEVNKATQQRLEELAQQQKAYEEEDITNVRQNITSILNRLDALKQDNQGKEDNAYHY